MHPSSDPAGEVAVAGRGEGPRTLSGDWRTLQGLAWSPSGEEILFTASREGRSQSLWAVSRSGRLRSVARWGGNWTLEDVAADGALLLTRGQVQLSMMALAPEQTRDLTWFDWSEPVDVTPDGRTVLFQEWGDGVGGAKAAFLRATDGSPAIRLGEGDPAAVSPDGRKALIYRPAPPRLVLVPAGPGQETTLPAGDDPKIRCRSYFPYSTAFFPGGTRFVFVAEAADELTRLWVQDVDGGPPQPFGPAEHLSNPTISPDGGSVAAFAEATGRLVVFSANGEVRRSMDLGKEESVPIGWFSDNRSVFLKVAVGNETRIDRLDTVSGKREVWRDLPIQDEAGILSGVLRELHQPGREDDRHLVSSPSERPLPRPERAIARKRRPAPADGRLQPALREWELATSFILPAVLYRLENVRKSFGTKDVLVDATWQHDPGRIVGLVGRNGAGKSTVLKIVQGLVEADGGKRLRRRRDDVRLARPGGRARRRRAAPGVRRARPGAPSRARARDAAPRGGHRHARRRRRPRGARRAPRRARRRARALRARGRLRGGRARGPGAHGRRPRARAVGPARGRALGRAEASRADRPAPSDGRRRSSSSTSPRTISTSPESSSSRAGSSSGRRAPASRRSSSRTTGGSSTPSRTASSKSRTAVSRTTRATTPRTAGSRPSASASARRRPRSSGR